MKICVTCGMPMTEKEHFGNADENCLSCTYCTNDDWSVKSCEEIFEWGVNYFIWALQVDRAFAEKLVRKNMLQLPYRRTLNWPIASDEEFDEAMSKLS